MVDKKFSLVKNMNFKLSYSFSSIKNEVDIKLNNPLFELYSSFSEIKNTAKEKLPNIMKYFCFNRNKIIKILYDEDQFINIDFDFDMLQKDDISKYFYLTILIEENKNKVDFTYSIKFIEKIDNEIKENNNSCLRNLIKLKIILELLKNFDGEKNEKKFKEIEAKNINRIKENIKKIKDLKIEINENDIKYKKLEQFYVSIIKSLIKSKKFEDFEYTKKIMNQMDLENINITNTIYEELLNMNEDYINNYKLTNVDDLFIDKNINFYFILFKYIFKDSLYIYQIDFLNNARKAVIQNLHLLSDLVNSNKNSNINKDKILYIIKMFIDSDYLYYKYIDNTIYKILNNSSFKLIKNEEGIIEYNEIKFGDYTIKYDELNKKNIRENNKIKESYKKFLQLLKDVKNELESKCKDLNDFSLELMFKMEKENNSIGSNLFNLTCIYKLNDYSNEFKDRDILKLKNISDSKDGFFKLTEMISELSKENNNSESTDIIGSNNNSNKIDNNHSSKFNHSLTTGSSREASNSSQKSKDNKKNKYSIIELIKIINYESKSEYKSESKSKSNSESEFIIEIQNKFLIVGFLNGKLILLNQNLQHIKDLKISYDNNNNNKEYDSSRRSKSIYETNESSPNEVNLISCSKFGCRKLVIKFKDDSFSQFMSYKETINDKVNLEDISKGTFSVFFQMGEKNDIYVLGGEKGIWQLDKMPLKGAYMGGIKINDNVIAFTSNSILSNGENKIIFYDINKAKKLEEAGIVKEIKKEIYSFTLSTNSLAKMKMHKLNESEMHKLNEGEMHKLNEGEWEYLLCGCQKYSSNQSNGILLIELKSNNEYNEVSFLDTEDFEVYCFCPISMTLKNSDNHVELYPTNYFFVGGFEKSKKMGVIKLYRLKGNDDKTEIEFVQDIIFEQDNEYKFDMNVSCIIQSKFTGEIFVTCWSGKIYKFSAPNITYYLNNDY